MVKLVCGEESLSSCRRDNLNQMLRHFFSYVRSGPPPEVPEVEPPDPAAGRSLSEPYRTARRTLVAVCGVCLAWSTAQFSLDQFRADAAGVTVNLSNASVPLLLGATLVYLTGRWTMEFAMMPRHVRRWPLAQLDFRAVSIVARFALLALTAGALDRSLRSVVGVTILLAALALVLAVLTTILMFVTMPVRMWARERAGVPSAASASAEALMWAVVFAVVLITVGNIALGVAIYRYEPLQVAIWPVPPHPIALAAFLLVLNFTFISFWLMRPVLNRLFAERPPYRTERAPDGTLQVTFVAPLKEPLL
jgi:hypothetical protein